MPRGQPGAVSSASRGRRLTGKPVTESNLILCVRAKIRRYLEPDFRCLRCKHGGSRASARTRYLEQCQGRELARNPLSLPLLGVCGCVRNAPRGHVNAADHLFSGTFSKRTPDNRRSVSPWHRIGSWANHIHNGMFCASPASRIRNPRIAPIRRCASESLPASSRATGTPSTDVGSGRARDAGR